MNIGCVLIAVSVFFLPEKKRELKTPAAEGYGPEDDEAAEDGED